MTIIYHPEVEQGSDEWAQLRCGLLTASEVKHIITPTLKIADNDKTRQHVYEIAAQRITSYVEPSYIGDDMLRGWDDEILAADLYSEHYEPIHKVGFVTNDELGFTMGFSPDGLVGEDGFTESKSRRQKYQVETISKWVETGDMPDDYKLQVQTGFVVTRRKWCDFISYSGGLPMITIRVYPDPVWTSAIIQAATAFEAKVVKTMGLFEQAKAAGARLIPTERRPPETEITGS